MESEVPAKTPPSFLKSLIWYLVKLLFAASIIAYLISTNKNDFFNAIKDFNLIWLLPAILIYTFHIFVCTWRWRLLLDMQNINISFFESFSLIMKGLFFSLVIPGGAIGGDIARAGLVASKAPKGSRLEGTFSILIDRFIGMLALFSLAILLVFISSPILSKVNSVMGELAIKGLIAACVAGLLSGIVIFSIHKLEKIRFIAALISFADRYSKGAVSRLTRALDIYRGHYKTIFFTVIVTIFCIHLAMGLIVYCIANGICTGPVSIQLVIVAVTFGNIAGFIPITPSGVGTRDSIVILILMAGGLTKGNATAMALIYTAIILSFNILGGLFFVFGNNKTEKKLGQAVSAANENV